MIFGGINLFLCYNIEVLLYVVYIYIYIYIYIHDIEMTILSMLYYGVGYDYVNGFTQS